MIITEPQTPEEFSSYYQLRWEVLRKPWNQPRGSETDSCEQQSTHAMAVNDSKEVTGVSRLQLNSPDTAQIRYMAVRDEFQGHGIGKELLAYLEKKAREQGARRIILDARDNAVEFYRKNGYLVLEKGHLLYGEIQHYKMEKYLGNL